MGGAVVNTLNDRIDAHLAKARAATPGEWLAHPPDNPNARYGESEDEWDAWQIETFAEGFAEGRAVLTIEAPSARDGRGATCCIVGNGPSSVANHDFIAANDPATIEAFCAVAQAAEAHMTAWDAMEEAVTEWQQSLYEEQHGQFISDQWKAELGAAQAEANPIEHRTAEALHAALAALYAALGKAQR